ncbi:MAG: DNA-3-methyladenine glycosylase [Bacillota bacterium]|nr:DNA-3-methyladenine glycosylase [Bacillota bacterium]
MNNIIQFDKNSAAIIHLSSVDTKLAALIDNIGEYTLLLRTDYTAAIIRAIIGQQLSVKAARTIWHRLEQLCGGVTPDAILSVSEEELRQAGLSKAKACYAKDFSMKVQSGEINFESLCGLEDEMVISTLTQVRGIGKWTAEMFLIFSLGRPDILPVDDLGLQRSIMWLYGLPDTPKRSELFELGQLWKPFRSVATLYLWDAVNRGIITSPTRIDN